MKSQRIAAGGIVINDGKILLVRYKNDESGSFLAAPGGRVEDNENIKEAIVREIIEETGILVEPNSVLTIEDLDCSKWKMCKIWMSCKYKKGEIVETQEAVEEEICDVGWYMKNELKNEVVYPSIIKSKPWELLMNAKTDIEIPSSRKASF